MGRLDAMMSLAAHSDMVKIRFRLTPDSDGYPPWESEGLWADPIGGGLYRVGNSPWFVFHLAADDIVRAEPDRDGVLWATERVEWSGNCTIRVALSGPGPLNGKVEAASRMFTSLGASCEWMTVSNRLRIGSLTVTPDSDVATIKAAVLNGAADGSWEHEEACISRAWQEA